MTALICGSMAFDTVMMFEGRFRDHILPDRLHVLNVSFEGVEGESLVTGLTELALATGSACS